MKKIKGIISIVLAAAMIFGCASVFASAAYPDKLTTVWGEEYSYGGEITVGENTITVNEIFSGDYFVFNVETEGYYVFDYEKEGSISSILLMEEYYSSYYDKIPGVVSVAGAELVYLEEGENYIGVWFGDVVNNTEKITVDYAGSEITDITFDAGTEYPIIYGYDITNDEFDRVRIYDFSLSFNTGKTFEFPDAPEYFDYSADNIKIGENEIEITIDGNNFPKILNVASITDYVEKVEMVNSIFEETVYYDGSSMGTGYFEFKIFFADGSSINVREYETFTLGEGNPYNYNISCTYYNGEGWVEIADHEYLRFTYKSEKASFIDNLGILFAYIGDEFYYITRIPEYAENIFAQDSAADSLRAFGEFVSFVNNQFIYAISDVFEQIAWFVKSV